MTSSENFTPYSKYVNTEKIIEDGFEFRAIPASTSTVMSTATLPTGHSKKNIKTFLKENLFPPNHDIRSVLYKNLVKRIPCNNAIFNKQMYIDFTADKSPTVAMKSSTIIPKFVEVDIEYYYLNEDGKSVLHIILHCVDQYFPQVSYCPFIASIAAIFLHYDDTPANVFEGICRILFASPKYVHYLDLTEQEATCSSMVFKELTIKHTPASHKSLQQFTKDPNTVYNQWLKCIFKCLPFNYLTLLIDMYLLEGYKALYRMAISLLKFYRKMGILKDSDILKSVFDFIKAIDTKVSPNVLFKKAYNLRLAPSKELQQYHKKQMSHLQNLPVLQDAIRKSRNPWDYSSIVHNVASEIINDTFFSTLYCWIPERFALEKPRRIFSTTMEGYNLNTFYQFAADVEPNILLIKTVNDEVFGAFCSSSWGKSNDRKFYGTGETFLFAFTPESKVYYWVGSSNYKSSNLKETESIQDAEQNRLNQATPNRIKLPTLSRAGSVTKSITTEEKESNLSLPPINIKAISGHSDVDQLGDKNLKESKTKMNSAASDYFMMADENNITIGGGNGFGIQLDKSFAVGVTERCSTFLNKPLVPSGQFKCSILELYGFGV